MLKVLAVANIFPVMANIKSAIKKIRVDARRTKANTAWKTRLKKALKKPENTVEVYKIADKMAGRHIISKNKAARIKSHAATKPQS